MKKILLLLAALLPLWGWTQSPVATFNSSWVEHNVVSSAGQMGVCFHFDINVDHCQGKQYELRLKIEDAGRLPVSSTLDGYKNSYGQFSYVDYINPSYEYTRYEDFRIFVPYEAVSRGTPSVYWVRICKDANSLTIGDSKRYSLEWASVVVNCDKPTIDWLSGYETTTASFAVKAGINSKSEVSATSLAVNGSVYRGMKTVKNDGYQMRVNETVTLREGSNEITLSATNSCGTTTKTYRVNFTRPYAEPSYDEKRVALVIGNAAYPTSKLENPINDANDIAATLRSLGFDVKTVLNGTKRDIEDAISDLRRRSDQNSVALFYYAGHGIQKDGANYLVPIDANMQDAADVEYACTDVNRVLANMESSGCNKNIIILDACRDNPFERSWSRGAGTRGLTNINAPRGTFISYATAPGDVAQDGKGRNSPYAEALINTLKTPGLDLYEVFQTVSTQVEDNTGGTQTPWISSSFRGRFYFNPQK